MAAHYWDTEDRWEIHLEWKHTNYFINRFLGHFHTWLIWSICFGTWCVLSLNSVLLGICENGNSASIRTKIICPRSHQRGGLSPIATTVELFACSEKAIRPDEPTNQAVSQYMMGNYVRCMKSSSVCFANASQKESQVNLEQRRSEMPKWNLVGLTFQNKIQRKPRLLLKMIKQYNDSYKESRNNSARLFHPDDWPLYKQNLRTCVHRCCPVRGQFIRTELGLTNFGPFRNVALWKSNPTKQKLQHCKNCNPCLNK